MWLLFILALAGCCDGTCPATPPPPSLAYPVVWKGADDARNAIVIMSPTTWIQLQHDIESARIWMRHANACIAGGE